MPHPADSENLFLAVVLERCEKTAGRALAALQTERVAALPLPHISQVAMISERLRPRIFLVDAGRPGREELEIIRLMRSKDASGSLLVVLLGDVPDKSLPHELCEHVNAYLRKPLDWKKVARTVIQLANNRRPPTTAVLFRKG